MSIAGIYHDFKIIKEDWNWYKIKDGSRLKIRFVLIKTDFSDVDEQGGVQVGLKHSIKVSAVVPEKLMGDPDKKNYNKNILSQSIEAKDLEFESEKEEWNEYLFKNGIKLKVKCILVEANRTNKYNEDGEPIYTINTQLIIKPDIPRKYKKRIS